MKSFTSFILIAVILFSFKCKADYVGSLSELSPITCSQGSRSLTPDIFSLKKLDVIPTPAQINSVIPELNSVTNPTAELGLRMEICFSSDDKAHLLRLVTRSGNSYPYEVYTEGVDYYFQTEGLDEAVFGDTTHLKLLLRFKKDTKAILIRGGPSFVGAISVSIKDVSSPVIWKITSLYGLLGELTFGDLLFKSVCKKAGQWESHSTLKLDSAHLIFDYCSYLGGGETTGYDIYKITITDNNPHLKVENRNKKMTFEGEDLKKYLRYHWGHHNACDSFVLSIPQWKAQYSATSSPAAGCGGQVEGAPNRSMDDPQEIQRKAIYQINYGEIVGVIRPLNQAHFLKNL